MDMDHDEMSADEHSPTSPNTSISLRRAVKEKLDVMAHLGRRTRTATVELLMDDYLARHPSFAVLVEQRISESQSAC